MSSYSRSRGISDRHLLNTYYDDHSSQNPYLRYEQAVVDIAYPAVIGMKQRRFFAKVLHDLHRAYQEKIRASQSSTVPESEPVQVRDLPLSVQKLLKDYLKTQAAIEKLSKKRAEYLTTLRGLSYLVEFMPEPRKEIRRRFTETELAARRKEREAYLAALNREGFEQSETFKAQVRAFANDQVLKTRLQLPQSILEVLDRLSKHKALPPGSPEPIAPVPPRDPIATMEVLNDARQKAGYPPMVGTVEAYREAHNQPVDAEAIDVDALIANAPSKSVAKRLRTQKARK